MTAATRAVTVICAVLALLPMAAPAQAQSGPETFFGKFKGTGISRSDDAQFYAITDRDLDVEIGPEGDGFFVRWTTVIRDLVDGEPRRRTSRVRFVPTGRPGYYKQRGDANPVEEGVLRWAHINGDTLTVQVLALPDEGGYGLQSYQRVVRGDQMSLTFFAVEDGQPVRFVNGQLDRE